MSREPRQPRAILRDGHVYLLQSDGRYVRQDPGEVAPDTCGLSDEEIDRRIDADPDAAPEPSNEELKRARIVRPYETSKST